MSQIDDFLDSRPAAARSSSVIDDFLKDAPDNKPQDNALARGFKKGAHSLNISKNLYFGDTAETAEAVREAGDRCAPRRLP